MKKFSRKSKLIISCLVIAILLAVTFAVIRINHSKKCQGIVGDGYAMGTDPEPIVIGNTCD